MKLFHRIMINYYSDMLESLTESSYTDRKREKYIRKIEHHERRLGYGND